MQAEIKSALKNWLLATDVYCNFVLAEAVSFQCEREKAVTILKGDFASKSFKAGKERSHRASAHLLGGIHMINTF